ncbi:hypothetical protein SNOG_03331 [Parastagonospora nodorum SN15]|uniref:Major facilitator superfamily (MFS) profile domain-containing protein n=1 Tax=Phaeosphaeria nodorum (strain SN15 / ATCC MYA-4574 / FGSC 10173) TaxID=321614 RepID=Q0UY33_PHANO|nr:hypothetical protein SNOG_03331 [Parastagonospora nodorum SN15]EAT88536.2 hypothetical protein SNOG_03331 [Parastagonospora nodorum SN15]
MGLRKWVSRPLRGRQIGVENLIAGGEGIPTIDQAPFQIWVVVVAGIGFLTDAFGLFALNVVTPMLGYVYWPSNDPNAVPEVPSSVKTAMMCSTLAGTMIGQVGFGFAADILGRRKMYGLELVIIIVGTMFLLMSSNGERNSMHVAGWLITWRAIMGVGIGADYPLSAPVGQLLANVLSLAAVEAYKPWIERSSHYCKPDDDECFRAIDRLWRLVVGIGIVPAVIALIFRFTIPESPRYTLDILQNTRATLEDTANYFDAPELHAEHGPVEMFPTRPEIHVSPRTSICSGIGPDEIIEDDSDSDRRPSDAHLRQPSPEPDLPPGDPNFVPPLASWTDAKKFFIAEVYGLGLSSPQIVSNIWGDPKIDKVVSKFPSVYETLHGNSLHTLVMVSIGTITGGLLMIKIVKHVSPKTIQFWGFLVLFVLFIVTGTEIFPTRYRCTCHGIAAASGKLGSWLVQIFLAYAFKSEDADDQNSWTNARFKDFGKVLQVMSAFMVAGAITTYFHVPETRDHDNKSRTLEVLACGKKVIDELNKQRRREDEDDS